MWLGLFPGAFFLAFSAYRRLYRIPELRDEVSSLEVLATKLE